MHACEESSQYCFFLCFLRFNELFVKGNKNISDREARNDTIVNLKMMIREWLNDNYPDMPLAERKIMVESMDMSLIDSKKAESLSTIYEINNVIRMSFIEAQFIKKVRVLTRSLTGCRRRNLNLRFLYFLGNDERVISSR